MQTSLHQVGTSSLLIYMMHGHTYILYRCQGPNSWQTPVAAVTVYSPPDDGRKGRPKHVGHNCSC